MDNAGNVKTRFEGNKLFIEIDMSQNFGPSKSGKTSIVASSGGFLKVNDDISLNLNVCKRIPK